MKKNSVQKTADHDRETEVVLYESEIETKAQLHAILKEACGFPAYYGGNFAALNDCLSEYSRPLSLILVLSTTHDDPQDFWSTFALVCMRQSLENPHISFRIEHERI